MQADAARFGELLGGVPLGQPADDLDLAGGEVEAIVERGVGETVHQRNSLKRDGDAHLGAEQLAAEEASAQLVVRRGGMDRTTHLGSGERHDVSAPVVCQRAQVLHHLADRGLGLLLGGFPADGGGEGGVLVDGVSLEVADADAFDERVEVTRQTLPLVREADEIAHARLERREEETEERQATHTELCGARSLLVEEESGGCGQAGHGDGEPHRIVDLVGHEKVAVDLALVKSAHVGAVQQLAVPHLEPEGVAADAADVEGAVVLHIGAERRLRVVLAVQGGEPGHLELKRCLVGAEEGAESSGDLAAPGVGIGSVKGREKNGKGRVQRGLFSGSERDGGRLRFTLNVC